MLDVAYCKAFLWKCFWKWDISLYDIIIVIRYRLNVISLQSLYSYCCSRCCCRSPHSIIIFNISLFSIHFPLLLLFIISLLCLLYFCVVFFFAGRGEKFKKQLIGFLRCGCFIASGLNVNVIMIIRNVFLFIHNNWMDGNYHLPTCATFPPFPLLVFIECVL